VEDQIRNPEEPVAPAEQISDATAPTGTTDAAAAPAQTRKTLKTAIEWALLIGGALVIALVVKAFFFQAFYIPSDSMVPTLKTDDRVIVNKLSYHLHAVHRGDIVVFKTPKGADGNPIDPTIKDLVKRVIGLPGETVGERDGQILINGKVLKESYLPARTISNCASFAPQCFPTGRLPANQYWVMGDNRPNSRDSRYFGAIRKSEIVGRVFVRVWPLNRLGLL
jgi:signal peptidase I